MSKSSFKLILQKASNESALKYLLSQKSKLKKGREISYSKLQTQKYFKSGNGISVHLMRWIFMMRSREINCASNFSSLYDNNKCISPQCDKTKLDSQEHIYLCDSLENKSSAMTLKPKYEEVFKNNVSQMISIASIFFHKYQHRLSLLSAEPGEYCTAQVYSCCTLCPADPGEDSDRQLATASCHPSLLGSSVRGRK